jgi:hypothetical protein
METKILYHIPFLREKGLNSKTTFLIKNSNVLLNLLYAVQNVKIVSIYNIQRKK